MPPHASHLVHSTAAPSRRAAARTATALSSLELQELEAVVDHRLERARRWDALCVVARGTLLVAIALVAAARWL
jgi:hypothetical protein